LLFEQITASSEKPETYTYSWLIMDLTLCIRTLQQGMLQYSLGLGRRLVLQAVTNISDAIIAPILNPEDHNRQI
jgi:hypothetical protein